MTNYLTPAMIQVESVACIVAESVDANRLHRGGRVPARPERVAGQLFGHPLSKTLLLNEEVAWHALVLRR